VIDTTPLKPLPIVRDLQGNVITKADLPSPKTRRWVNSRKAILVRAVQGDIITREELLELYNMEDREFAIWEREFAQYGAEGLKQTKMQKRRTPRE
jgi:hypothetical protein